MSVELPKTVHDYARLVQERTHFAQANYGDGEWACLLGRSGTNVNGERYVPQLAEALRMTLLQPSGIWCGTNPGRRLAADVERWVSAHDVTGPWVYKEILSGANAMGQLAPFLRAVRTRSVVIVGPPHLRTLPDAVVGPHGFVEVPESTAWREADRVADQVLVLVRAGADLVLFSAGMGSNLMIHRLWPHAKHRATLLDMGATFDPYVGRFTRKHYRRPSFQEVVMHRNLE